MLAFNDDIDVVTELVECAEGALVCRNDVLSEPGAACELVEILAWVHGRVHGSPHAGGYGGPQGVCYVNGHSFDVSVKLLESLIVIHCI